MFVYHKPTPGLGRTGEYVTKSILAEPTITISGLLVSVKLDIIAKRAYN